MGHLTCIDTDGNCPTSEDEFRLLSTGKLYFVNIERNYPVADNKIETNCGIIALTPLEYSIYNFIRYGNGEFSLPDIVFEIDEKLDNSGIFTDGHDDTYIKMAQESIICKACTKFVLDMIAYRIFYIA